MKQKKGLTFKKTVVGQNIEDFIDRIEAEGSGLMSSSSGDVGSIKAGRDGLFNSSSGDVGSIDAGGIGLSNSSSGDVGSIEAGGSGLWNSSSGDVGSIKAGGSGLLNSSSGDVGSITAGKEGLLNSSSRNVGSIEAGWNGLVNSFVSGYVGDVDCGVSLFDNSKLNLVVGSVRAKRLDINTTLTNLVVSDDFHVGSHNGTVNVILDRETEDFIHYTGDFEELKEYVKQNARSLAGIRSLRIEKRVIQSIDELLELNLEHEQRLGANNIEYVNLIRESFDISDEDILCDRVKEYSPLQNYLTDTSITTGGRALLTSRLLRRRKEGIDEEEIKEELKSIYTKIKEVEKALEGTPTLGLEFAFEEDEQTKERLKIANILLRVSGAKKIRDSECKNSNVEVRVSPSYSPILSALVDDMFELDVLPKENLISYNVCMVGKYVIEYAVLLIIVNYFTGFTPFPAQQEERQDAIGLRDVHVYNGATTCPNTGSIIRARQLNISAGVTGKEIKEKRLDGTLTKLIEGDVSNRLYRMALPFVTDTKEWAEKVLEIVGIDSETERRVHGEIVKANTDGDIYRGSNFILPESDKEKSRLVWEVHNLYREMSGRICIGDNAQLEALNVRL